MIWKMLFVFAVFGLLVVLSGCASESCTKLQIPNVGKIEFGCSMVPESEPARAEKGLESEVEFNK